MPPNITSSYLPFPTIPTSHALLTKSLTELRAGVRSRDERQAKRGLRQIQICSSLLLEFDLEDRAELVGLCLEMGLDPTWQWTSLWSATSALNAASKLLTPKRTGLRVLVQDMVGWERLWKCAKLVHGKEIVTARISGDDALRSHSDALGLLCRRARFYQARGTARAVCEEFEAACLNRMDVNQQEAQIFMYLFYPSPDVNGDDDLQARLPKWMDAWGTVDSSNEWDAAWFSLIRRLTKTKRVNPLPFLSQLYGRFHASLRLTNSANGFFQSQSGTRTISPWQGLLSKTVLSIKAAKLLIDILHVGDSIKRLEHMLITVRTFMHPSNQGSHSDRLSLFIATLCESFVKRLGREAAERAENVAVSLAGAVDTTLSLDVKNRFVEAVFPLIEMGLLSKSISVVNVCQGALRHLAWVAPRTISKKTLTGLIQSGLDPLNLTRAHQAPAAMKALTVLVQPLLSTNGTKDRAVILRNLLPFLEQSLPGIDPNDSRKTAVTFMLTYSVLLFVPLVGSSAMESHDDSLMELDPIELKEFALSNTVPQFTLDAAEKIVDGSAMENILTPVQGAEISLSALGDNLTMWGLSFLRRLFTLAQTRGKRAKKGMSAQLDVVLDYFFLETAVLCLRRMDSTTRAVAVKEIASFFVDEGALPEAHDEASMLARACTRADPEAALKSIVPGLCVKLKDEKVDARVASWALVGLGGVIREAGGPTLVELIPQIDQVCVKLFTHKDVKVRKLACKLVRRTTRALLATYITRDVKYQDALLVREAKFGKSSPVGYADVKPCWHVPSALEQEVGVKFLKSNFERAFEEIDALVQGGVSSTVGVTQPTSTSTEDKLTNKEKLRQALQLLVQSIRAGLTVFHNDDGDAAQVATQDEALSRPKLIARTIAICNRLQASTDIPSMRLLTKALKLLGSAAQGPRGCGSGEHVRGFSMWSSWLREITQCKAHEAYVHHRFRLQYQIQKRGDGSVPDLLDQAEPHHVVIKQIENLQQKYVFENSYRYAQKIRNENEREAPFRAAGDTLAILGQNTFSSVRIAAQAARAQIDSRFPWIAKERLVDDFIVKLGNAGTGSLPEVFTGALYSCGSDMNLGLLSQRWDAFSKFVRVSVCESGPRIESLPPHRQVKAQERMFRLLLNVLQRWHALPENTVVRSEYAALLLDLSVLGNDRTQHWRRKLTACAVLGLLIDPRFENDIPRDVVSFVVNSARAEMLPLRTVASFVLRRLILCGESVKHLTACEIYIAGGSAASTTATDKALEFWQTCGSTLAEDRSSAQADDQKADWSVGVGELIKLCRGLVRRPRFPKSAKLDVSAAKDFHFSKSDFWSSLCQLAEFAQVSDEDLLNKIALPTIKKLAFEGESAKDRLIRKMAACEMFAGCLVAKPIFTKPFYFIMNRLLAESPKANNWCDAVMYVSSFDCEMELTGLLRQEIDKQLQKNSAAADDEPSTEMEKEVGFSFLSNVLRVSASLFFERMRRVPDDFMQAFVKCMVHPYKAVRESASQALAAFTVFDMVDYRLSVPATLAAASKGKDGLEAGLLFVSVVCGLGTAQQMLDEVLMPLAGPVVFFAQDHEDVELLAFAKQVLIVMSSWRCISVPEKAAKFEAKIVQDFTKHEEWPMRRAVATFLQQFHTQHTCSLLGMGAGGLVQKTSEELLHDPQAEVRDAARRLLLSLLAAAPPTSLSSAKDRYTRMIASGDVAKKRQGVLALTALVEACPYSVPPALPGAIAELAKQVAQGTDESGRSQARKTLSEFRRTHQDEWAVHKVSFTADQLNELEGVIVSPDHYA